MGGKNNYNYLASFFCFLCMVAFKYEIWKKYTSVICCIFFKKNKFMDATKSRLFKNLQKRISIPKNMLFINLPFQHYKYPYFFINVGSKTVRVKFIFKSILQQVINLEGSFYTFQDKSKSREKHKLWRLKSKVRLQ